MAKTIPIMTRDQSAAKVRLWRKQGYRIKRIKLPDGSTLVLRSKKRFVCSAGGCEERPALPRRRVAKRKRTTARRRR